MAVSNISLCRSLVLLSALACGAPAADLAEAPADVQHLDAYVPDPSPVVQKRIEEWRDLKLGLLMHWGTYSQLGIVESWSICPEDEGWCLPKNVANYEDYRRFYEHLPATFNPTRFEPERWAAAAKRAGMKYVVFTTKHHDGFCMYDSQYSDYKITSPASGFAGNPKADVTKEIFSAFRKEGFWIGAYFSKPDWHSQDFWWSRFPPKDRNPNYDVERYPERWKSFVAFTHNQVLELVNNYGPLDLLWFDGGWVKKSAAGAAPAIKLPEGYTVVKEPNLDIQMDQLVEKVRKVRPSLIVVDRAVHGKNQNYLTPENQVPDKVLPYPWESCIILGGGWSYSLDAEFKSPRELVHLLADIVAKGGNLLLNIGPSPAGTWYDAAYQRLDALGAWMDINHDAIYGTRPWKTASLGDVRFTVKNDGTVNALLLLKEGVDSLPESLRLPGIHFSDSASATLLGAPDTKIVIADNMDGSVLRVLAAPGIKAPSTLALVFQIKNP